MTLYECKPCGFQTKLKANYTTHLTTNKHKLNTKIISECKFCNYKTIKKTDYTRHLLSKKHLNNSSVQNNNHNMEEKMEQLLNEIQKLKEINEKNTVVIKENNNQNTNKLIGEARNMKKSILTLLNTHFKDSPSIEYIQEKPFIVELEKEYKCKVNDGSDKIFMRIFTDYEKKKLVKTLSELILKFVKKDDQTFQSVFNIDSARSNFATKIDDFWLNDKKGLQLRKFTIDKVIYFMIEVLEVFRLQLVKIREQNIKKPETSRSDYLMKNQALLLEVVSFLNHPSTHTKIIQQLSPNLRCDEQLFLEI
jgi:hypothetical protein